MTTYRLITTIACMGIFLVGMIAGSALQQGAYTYAAIYAFAGLLIAWQVATGVSK